MRMTVPPTPVCKPSEADKPDSEAPALFIREKIQAGRSDQPIFLFRLQYMEKTSVNNKAFTLVEALIALVILTMIAAGLIIPFASSAASEQQGCKQTIAAKLACDLVEQIIAADFNQIVPAYNGYNEQKGQIKNAAGVNFTGPMYADLSRQAVCEYIYVPQQSGFGTPNFIKITVRIYQNNLKLAEVVRLKSR